LILTITRLDTHPDGGTIGALSINCAPICWTLEPYLYGNMPNRSAIMAQPYIIRPYLSQRYGSTWEVQEVYGRDYILFHAGNTAADTEGCILPGMQIGELHGHVAVLGSRVALNKVLALLQGADEHKLIIKEVFG
jgi:hypothetical protein